MRHFVDGTVILQSHADDVVPFSDSEELVRNSGLPASVGMLKVCEAG